MRQLCGATLEEPGKRWQCCREPHSGPHWAECWEDVDRRRGDVVYYVEGEREWT